MSIKIKKPQSFKFEAFNDVDPPGLEPGQTAPKAVVLPLHHGSVSIAMQK